MILAYSILAHSQEVFTPAPIKDSCYRILDYPQNSILMTKSEILAIDSLYFSQDLCISEEYEKRKAMCWIVFNYKDRPTEILMSNTLFRTPITERLNSLVAGDTVILEQCKFHRGKEIYETLNLLITIREENFIDFPKPDRIDTCFRIFNEAEYLKTDSITKADLISLDSFYFSKDLCSNSKIDTTYIEYFRIVIVPVKQNPSIITGGNKLTTQMKRYILELTPGSRVILEGISYFKGEERIGIPPLIYIIKD